MEKGGFIKDKLGNIAIGRENRQLSIMLTQIILHCVDRYPCDCFGGRGADRVGSGFTGNRLRHSGRGSGQVGNGQHRGGGRCIPKPKPHRSSVYFSSKQLTLSIDDASRRLMEIVSSRGTIIQFKIESENLYKNGR